MSEPKLVTNIDLQRQIKALDARLSATNKHIDFTLDLLGLGDLAGISFSSKELQDAGGFLPAYFRRRGVTNRVDFHRALSGIEPLNGNDVRRVDPDKTGALPRMVFINVTDFDEFRERVGLAHAPEAESPALVRQAAPLTALTVTELARTLRDFADRAFNPALRFPDEADDRMMLGKLAALDAICEPLWLDDRMTPDEETQLRESKTYADKAWNHLLDKIEPAA